MDEVTVFNRRKLITVMDFDDKNIIVKILKDNDIEYKVVVRDIKNVWLLGKKAAAVGKSRVDKNFVYKYTIYVKGEKLEKAKNAINRCVL